MLSFRGPSLPEESLCAASLPPSSIEERFLASLGMTAWWAGVLLPIGSRPRISSSVRYAAPAAPIFAPLDAGAAAPPCPVSVPAQSRSTCVPLLIVLSLSGLWRAYRTSGAQHRGHRESQRGTQKFGAVKNQRALQNSPASSLCFSVSSVLSLAL